MALQGNIGERAQENMKRLVQAESTNQKLREILEETIKANQGKTREQILAIFEERKKQFGADLQKQAIESARASMIPTFRKNAVEDLVEERLKLQEAKRLGMSPDESDVDGAIKQMAERNKMTPAQFAQHMKGMGVEIDTMKARFRANMVWGDVIRRRYSSPGQRQPARHRPLGGH